MQHTLQHARYHLAAEDEFPTLTQMNRSPSFELGLLSPTLQSLLTAGSPVYQYQFDGEQNGYFIRRLPNNRFHVMELVINTEDSTDYVDLMRQLFTIAPPAEEVEALESLKIDRATTSQAATTKTVSAYLAQHPDSSLQQFIHWVDQYLSQGRVEIPSDNETPLWTLLSMLPPQLQAHISYALHDNQQPITMDGIHIILNPDMDVHQTQSSFESAYTQYLAQYDDIPELIAAIWQLEPYLADDLAAEDLAIQLQTAIEEHTLIEQIHNDPSTIPSPILLEFLQNDSELPNAVEQSAWQQVLINGLEARDEDVLRFVDDAIQQDILSLESTREIIEPAIETDPDAVYTFSRLHLQTVDAYDEPWLSWIQRAAESACIVAITDSDTETIIQWLQLISREPDDYGLTAVLTRAMVAAQARITENPQLAHELIEITLKNDSTLLEALLNDKTFVAQLTPEVQQALFNYDTAALENVSSQSRDIFLLALSRAIENTTEPVISSKIVRMLWEIGKTALPRKIPEQYHPSQLMLAMVQQAKTSMKSGAIETLLTLLVSNGEDEIFQKFAHALKQQQLLIPSVHHALQNSTRSDSEVVTLVSNLQHQETLTVQEVIDTYVMLLDEMGWGTAQDDMIEQLARVAQQHPDTILPTQALWRTLSFASGTQSETIARTTTRRLLDQTGDIANENQVLENLQRMWEMTHWSEETQSRILLWWRMYIPSLSPAQVQQIEQKLKDNRSLDNFLTILRTTQAVQKVLGKRNLEEFAQAIDTTYRILQDLTDAFDPQGRNIIPLDTETLRIEMERHGSELPASQQHLFATNLKELTQVIVAMADNRSKGTIIRNDETLERSFMTGKQTPQSAIDLMKWLSGYWDGMQGDADAEL